MYDARATLLRLGSARHHHGPGITGLVGLDGAAVFLRGWRGIQHVLCANETAAYLSVRLCRQKGGTASRSRPDGMRGAEARSCEGETNGLALFGCGVVFRPGLRSPRFPCQSTPRL